MTPRGRVAPGEVLTRYTDAHGVRRRVPVRTVRVLEAALGPAAPPLPDREALTAFEPDWLASGGRAFGLSIQLYAIRSRRNWGMGDFTDLAAILAWAEARGALYLGVNPLHVLFAAAPERRSPYFPSSRLFLNPLYIDPEALAAELGLALGPTDEEAGAIDRARASAQVDYVAVATAKLSRLERLHAAARRDPRPALDADRVDFVRRGGEPLLRQAVFDAVSEEMAPDYGAGFGGWPLEFQDPQSKDVNAFAARREERVSFHLFLQWAADRQLRSATAGRRCSLYLDVAVGAAPDGAEVWSRRSAYVIGARLGAPPDLLAALGQDWGLAPFNPRRLAAEEFEPLRSVLAASMSHAGAVRIDHILGFDRQFMIPPKARAAEGAYVAFPLRDMIHACARESRAAGCLVIGEALGTVPEGLVQRLHGAGILSYEVARWARTEDGDPLPAGSYPRPCLAVLGTHDLATLPAYIAGADIALRVRLGLADTAQARREAAERESELRALCRIWGTQANAPPAGIVTAAHGFLARSSAALVMGNLEDCLLQVEQVNLPGTTDLYPNWACKYAVDLEDWMESESVRQRTEALRRR